MAVVVEPAVWDVLPGWRLVLLAGAGLANDVARPGIALEADAACAEARARVALDGLAQHPGIAPWRPLMPRKERAAHESLLRRVLGGKELPRVNPLVDLYNARSVAHVAPMGAWDVDALAGGDLRLFVTRGGEPFTEIGASAGVAVEPGEIAYGDAEVLVTRHFVWRQAERAKVTPATRRFVLVSEVVPGLGPRAAEGILEDLRARLRQHFGLACSGTVLAAPQTRWEWDA